MQNTTYPVENRYTNKQILLFVDTATYQQLDSRLIRYAADVKTDIGANVTIINGTWSSPEQIRSIIETYYAKGNLLGSVLVGNIPFIYMESGGSTFLSDWYYESLNSTFVPVGNSGDVFSVVGSNAYTNRRVVWSSRILPPASGQEGITLLENYFDKDHAYREGNLHYNGVFYLNGVNQYPESVYTANYSTLGTGLGFSGNTTLIYLNTSKLASLKYSSVLNAISQPNLLAIINIHGDPTDELVGQATYITRGNLTYATSPGYITSENITNTKSNSLYALLLSCSNGNFSTSDYLAGAYLFYGNTLAVVGFSVPTEIIGQASPSIFNYLKPLSQGVNIGEVWLADGNTGDGLLFGDPTLSLINTSSYPKTYPKIVLSTDSVNFGSYTEAQINNSTTLSGGSGNTTRDVEAKIINLTVKNSGNATLIMNFSPTTSYAIEGGNLASFGEVSTQYQGFVNFVIPPGQSINIPMAFTPSTETPPGAYKIILGYITNDPRNPYLTFTLNATVIQ
jgi:hypothetical protein